MIKYPAVTPNDIFRCLIKEFRTGEKNKVSAINTKGYGFAVTYINIYKENFPEIFLLKYLNFFTFLCYFHCKWKYNSYEHLCFLPFNFFSCWHLFNHLRHITFILINVCIFTFNLIRPLKILNCVQKPIGR